MRLISIWMQEENLKALKTLGKEKGGLKVSQLIRLAVSEFLKREARQK